MKFKFALLALIGLSLTFNSFVHAQGPPAIPTTPKLPWPGDDQFPGEGPIPKTDWHKMTWADRRVEFQENKKEDHGAVVFLGDAITQGWHMLAYDFPDLKVANRGIIGDTTRVVWQRLNEDVLQLDPAAVVLLIGTDDLAAGGDPAKIAGNIKGILKAIHKHNANTPIIVCKVMPSTAKLHRPADKIKALNALVDKIVKTEPHCVRCDTWSIFANEQGDAKPEEFKDLLHPTPAAYAKWKAALDPIFAQLKSAKP